jgi:hypothetical protein
MSKISFLLTSAFLTTLAFAGTGPAHFRFEHTAGGYSAVNRNLQMHFTGDHSDFIYQGSRLRLSLANEGPVLGSSMEGPRVRFRHGRVTEWFVNGEAGLEQGFTVASRQATGKLSLTIDISGDLLPALSGPEIVFRSAGSDRLRYAGLKSWDRNGRVLPSRVTLDGRQLRIEVDDAAASYPVTVDPVIRQMVLVGADTQSGDSAGSSVALSSDGTTALVGAPHKNNNNGVVYVFVRSGNAWTQQAELSNGDTTADYFGNSVALSADGNTALVGANAAPGVPLCVFTRSGNTWSAPVGIPNPDLQFPLFGYSVALSADGKTALIGQPGLTAYVFTLQNGAWTQQQNLLTSNFAVALYGDAVALSGDGNTALVGDYGTNGVGAVAVFARSGGTWTEQTPLTSLSPAFEGEFGSSVALNGDGTTALVGAPGYSQGAVFVYARGANAWTQQQEITGDGVGSSVAVSGDGNLALLGAPSEGAAYPFTRSGSVWTKADQLSTGADSAAYDFGYSVALSSNGNIALPGAIHANTGTGAAYPFALTDVSLNSMPVGQSFTLAGTGCLSGTFSTPYSGYWSVPCSVQWLSPDLSGMQYAFQNWSDGYPDSLRTIDPVSLTATNLTTYTADFEIQYQLTTISSPGTGGQISPATGTWYTPGSKASVVATPNPGYIFTGFSGALSGETSPQILAMNGPNTVTANFIAMPASAESVVITGKSGPANARQWTINVANSGPGAAYAAQLVGLIFTQTYGTACTPLRDSPVLPVALGDIASGANAQVVATLDFSSCASSARFSVAIMYVADGGSAGGTTQLTNQLQ